VLPFAKTQPEEIIDRFAGEFGGAVQQSNIHRALRGHIAGRDAIHVSHAARHISEGKSGRVELAQEFFDSVHGFTVAGNGRSFPETGDAIFFSKPDYDDGTIVSAATSNGPSVDKAEVNPPEC
jgi:hypothetical protein